MGATLPVCCKEDSKIPDTALWAPWNKTTRFKVWSISEYSLWAPTSGCSWGKWRLAWENRKSLWTAFRLYCMTLNISKYHLAKPLPHFSWLENKTQVSLESQFSPRAHGLSHFMAVPLLRILPLSSPQVPWEQFGCNSFTLTCGSHFSPAKKVLVHIM